MLSKSGPATVERIPSEENPAWTTYVGFHNYNFRGCGIGLRRSP